MYPDNKNLAIRAAELGDNWIQNIANMGSPFVVYPAVINAF
jgi:hypothetical protein